MQPLKKIKQKEIDVLAKDSDKGIELGLEEFMASSISGFDILSWGLHLSFVLVVPFT